MTEDKILTNASNDDDYQDEILQGVSRTFALTIPQLPPPLVKVVGNAYLLCRITDTIEDEPALTPQQKSDFSRQFINVVEGAGSAQGFSEALTPLLSNSTLATERDLVNHTASVIRVLRRFTQEQQAALQRCVTIMSEGMSSFQLKKNKNGVQNIEQMNLYCYYVAGIVGEMLTELLCDYSEAINIHKAGLMSLAVSFGQGLQMTNILKDIREDYQRGACWLPREHFLKHGYNLEKLSTREDQERFKQGLGELLSIAQDHLRNALNYTLLIPRKETGVRQFCLLAIGMALLTLRKIHKNPYYQTGKEVKITRRSVITTIVITKIFSRSNLVLKLLFTLLTRRI